MTLELKNILYFYTVLKYMYYVDVDLFVLEIKVQKLWNSCMFHIPIFDILLAELLCESEIV